MYKDDFQKAIERTKKFDLKCPDIEFSDGIILTELASEKYLEALGRKAVQLGFNDIFAQCLQLNCRLQPHVDKIIGTKSIFTIGSVTFGENRSFHLSDKQIASMIRNGLSTTSLDIHA